MTEENPAAHRSEAAPGAHAAVVVNPVKADAARLRAAVSAEERNLGWEPSRWFETTPEDAGHGAALSALESGPSVVIVAGGDGTTGAVAEVLQGSGVPLALVPAGTGNLLARNLGLPVTDLESSVSTAFTGSDRRIDVGVAELERADHTTQSSIFLVMAGIGLDARMASNTSAALKKRIGWLAYTDPIGRSVLANKNYSMHYSIDGARTRSAHAHTVIVGNCGTLTANILLLPDAVIDDGLLDVVVLRPTSVGGWAGIGSRLALGGILHRSRAGRLVLAGLPDLRALGYVQARHLTVSFNIPQELELDGDSVGPVTAVTVSTRHKALTIRTP